MSDIKLIHGDCLEVMRGMADNSVDAVITDPPYELGFMGKKWDNSGIAYNVEMWKEVLRVLKPGGHLLSFGGSRTYHRMACAIEDAGFEIRDQIMWMYGSGFPKSHNIGNAIKKELGCKAEKLNVSIAEIILNQLNEMSEMDFQDTVQELVLVKVKDAGKLEFVKTVEKNFISLGRTPEERTEESKEHFALMYVNLNGKKKTLSVKITLIGEVENSSEVMDTLQLQLETENIGLNTQLSLKKILADKSNAMRMSTILTEIDKTIELKICNYLQNQNMQSYITNNHSALKPAHEPICLARKPLAEKTIAGNVLEWRTGGINVDGCRVEGEMWKAHDATGLAEEKFFTRGEAKTIHKEPHSQGRFPANFIHDGSDDVIGLLPNDSARFFYCAKASKRDRDEGLEGIEKKLGGSLEGGNDKRKGDKPQLSMRKNHHPTVKPTTLMRYLCRLITPPNGTVLDPFMGSGSTGKGAVLEGFRFVGIEQEEEYIEIAKMRIEEAQKHQPNLFEVME